MNVFLLRYLNLNSAQSFHFEGIPICFVKLSILLLALPTIVCFADSGE